jgi:protein ImuB
MFGCVYGAEGSSIATLLEVARDFSPRIETSAHDGRDVTLDLSGLARLFGDAKTIAGELRRTAADRGLRVRVAIAGTRTAARLVAHHVAGITVVEPGMELAALALLPIDLLRVVVEEPDLPTLKRWGLRTLGDLATLPDDEVAARLGQSGVAWQRLARGEDPRPLVPAAPEERFEQALDLEWPIDGLEPLSFVLGRLMEPLSAHLERRDRGAAVLHVRLHLVTREVHERSLQLPAPMRDARTLRTLAVLDLESHPPSAAIDRVVVAVDPTPGRVLQFSLLTRPLPSPEQMSTLVARLSAVMGEGRCGSPVEVDSWRPGAFAVKPFAPPDPSALHRDEPPGRGDAEQEKPKGLCVSASPRPVGVCAVALRRFRFPIPARVRLDDSKPSRVTTDRRGLSGGRVETCAGPWRTSGAWWGNAGGNAGGNATWDRDEWDVTIDDGATYRLFHERNTDHWFIEGIVD